MSVAKVANTSGAGAVTEGTSTAGAEEVARKWLALAVIAVAQLMVVLDASIVNIALPSAQHDLGISDVNRQWVITAYTLAFGGLLLLGGRVADFVGRKRMFVIGLVGFAAASALGGAAANGAMLFSSRALQGVFGAMLAPAALSLITVTFTKPVERAKAFGVYGAIAGGGAAIGLVLGGILTQYASWRWCLLVNVPIAVVTVIAAIPIVRESRATGDRRYDLPGALTATLGLVSLVYGFTKANTDGWSSPVTLAWITAGVGLLVIFVIIEARATHPVLPLRVVVDRNRGGSFLTSFLVGVALFGMFLFLTYYMQGTKGYSALKAGFAFLPFSAGVILAAGLASRLLPRFGPRPLMSTGLLMAACGMGWLTRLTPTSGYSEHLLPSMLLMSMGMGLTFVPLASTALTGVAPHDAGVASAMVNTTQQVGGSLGTALLNTIAATATAGFVAAASGPPAIAAGLVHGYTVAFGWETAILLIAALVAFSAIRGRPGRPARDSVA